MSEGSINFLDANVLIRYLVKDDADVSDKAQQIIDSGVALLWAAAREKSSAVVYSFDNRFPGKGIELRNQLDDY